MQIKLENPTEVNDRTKQDSNDVWVTIELNEINLTKLENNKPFGFEFNNHKFMIVRVE